LLSYQRIVVSEPGASENRVPPDRAGSFTKKEPERPSFGQIHNKKAPAEIQVPILFQRFAKNERGIEGAAADRGAQSAPGIDLPYLRRPGAADNGTQTTKRCPANRTHHSADAFLIYRLKKAIAGPKEETGSLSFVAWAQSSRPASIRNGENL
jgi:hypothetical protein